MIGFDAIVLTGGRGSRLGGADKAALRLHDTTFLDRALAAVEGARAVVLVGPPPERPTGPALVTREDPPFSGPAAGIAAGVAALAAGREPAPYTVLLACDMPHAATAIPVLVAAAAGVAQGDAGGQDHACGQDGDIGRVGAGPDGAGGSGDAPGRDGAAALDDSGRAQPLLSCVATGALRAALAAAGPLTDAPVRRIVAHLSLAAVPVPSGSADDVDTPADARRVGATVVNEGRPAMPHEEVDLEGWANELCGALELPASAAGHVDEVLDVTRDAAHAIARPAAPIAAFLVGMAAGRSGGTDEAIAQACATAIRLAKTHQKAE